MREEDHVYLLNRIEVLGEVRSPDLRIRVLRAIDLPGNAGYGTGEVTHTVYIAVSEYDELPEQRLFRWTGLLAPVFPKAEHAEDFDPHVIRFTEGYSRLLPRHGYTISSSPDYGYRTPEPGRRKVAIWSQEPWRQITKGNESPLPPGR